MSKCNGNNCHQLNRKLIKAIQNAYGEAERGESIDLGSFAQYLEDNDGEDSDYNHEGVRPGPRKDQQGMA